MCTPIAVRLVADLTVLARRSTKGRSRLLQRTRQVLAALAVLCVGLIAFSPIAEAQSVTASPVVGSQPVAVAVNPVTNQVYVANSFSNTVTVIDGATNNTTTVTVGTNPLAVAVNPVTNKVYVANGGSGIGIGTVTVIDGATNNTTTVTVGNNPLAVAVNPVTNQVYVTSDGDGTGNGNSGGTVTVIDGATNNTTTVTAGIQPLAVAVNPVTNKVYVANHSFNTVTVIDGATNNTTTVIVGNNPDAVAVNLVTNQVYVANNGGNNTLTVIDGATNNTTTVTVGSQPIAVALNPVTNKVYVANLADGTMTVIDGATNNTTTVTVGNNPLAVAVNSVTNKVYVANQGSGTVTVIDGVTNNTSTVTLGNQPEAVAVNPVTNKVYVANDGSGTVTVIDGATNNTTPVAVGSQPVAVAVNPVPNKVYVANKSSNTVTVIDGAANNTATVAVGSSPVAVAVNPATNQAYVANDGSGTVTVIDGAANNTTTVTVGSQPVAVAVNPVTNKVYVANSSSNTVTVIDGATNNTGTVTVGNNPLAVAVNSVTNKVYVANQGSGTVTVIDGVTNTITTVPVGSQPQALAVNPVTNRVYVANDGSGTVMVIDGATNNTATVAVGSNPIAVAVNPVTNKVYVANQGSGTVTVIDGATNNTTTVTVGSAPWAVTVNPVTNKVYVANSADGTVTVIDGATNTTTTVAVGNNPTAVGVNPVTNQIYVANYNDGTVTVIDGAGTGGLQTVPLSISTTAPTTDPLTVAAANANLGTPYSTTNPAPVLTATVTSAYATSSTYSGDSAQTRGNPSPTALYYQVDGNNGTWSLATISPAAGSNPATFSIPLTGQTSGLHEVYLYAAYGNEGVPASSGEGSGNSPEISNLTAFPYLVFPAPTTTTLSADSNPLEVNSTVTFTATVSSTTGTSAPTGSVIFFDSITGTPMLLGSGSLAAVNGRDIAELETNFTAGGSHPIVAVYRGDAMYASSTSSSLTENVDLLAATQAIATAVLSKNHAAAAFTPVTGTGGTSPLSYSVAPALPAGLSMASATGTISGTPTVAGPATSYTVTVTDANSATATATFSLTINQPTPTILWATPAAILYGTALSATQLNASSSVAGTFTYSPAAGTVQSAGSHPLTVTFTPTDTTEYTPTTDTVSLTVNQATPTITWAPPAAIAYGTALSATQLNATASVAGSFIYSPPAGTVLGGSQPLMATFTPTDTTDYTPAAATVTLTLSAQTVPVLTFAPIPPQAEGAAPFAVSATSASSGAVTYAVLIGPATIAGNMVTATGVGTVVLVANQVASGSYAAAVTATSFSVGLPFTLTAATGSTTGSSASVAAGSVASFNLTLAPAGATTFPDPITFSVAGLPTGATATFSPATIAAGSAVTPVTLSIQTANTTTTARNEQPTSGNPLTPVALGFLLLPLLGIKATHRRLRQMPRLAAVLLAVGLSLVAVLGISGCSGGSAIPPAVTTPAAQTYTLVATAMDTTTKAQSTTNLTLTVQ